MMAYTGHKVKYILNYLLVIHKKRPNIGIIYECFLIMCLELQILQRINHVLLDAQCFGHDLVAVESVFGFVPVAAGIIFESGCAFGGKATARGAEVCKINS